MIRTIFEQKMLAMVKKKRCRCSAFVSECTDSEDPLRSMLHLGLVELVKPCRRGERGDGFSWTFRGVAYASHGADSRTPGAGYLSV